MKRRHPYTSDRMRPYTVDHQKTTALTRDSKAVGTRLPTVPRRLNAVAVPHIPELPTISKIETARPPETASAAAIVFRIPELVEKIFRQYEAADSHGYQHVATMTVILKLQLINSVMRGVVLNSHYFSRLLFITERPGATKPWFVQTWNNSINPIISHAPLKLRDCLSPLVQVSWGMTSHQFRLHFKYEYELNGGQTSLAQDFRSILERRAKHSTGTWRTMRLHYMEKMDVVIVLCVGGRHWDDGGKEMVYKGTHHVSLPWDANLGTVVDRLRSLIAWIEGVAVEGHDLENVGEEWMAC